MVDLMCLNLATLRRLDYEAQLKTSARAGFHAVGLQMVAVEKYLASGRSLAEARSVLDALGLVAPEMNFIPRLDLHPRKGKNGGSQAFRALLRRIGSPGLPGHHLDDQLRKRRLMTCWRMKTIWRSVAWPGNAASSPDWNSCRGRRSRRLRMRGDLVERVNHPAARDRTRHLPSREGRLPS